MNLEEFRAGRTFSPTGAPGYEFTDDGEMMTITGDVTFSHDDGEPKQLPAYVYPHGLTIEKQSEGNYVLTIANCIMPSTDLAHLEEALYNWAKDEGYWD